MLGLILLAQATAAQLPLDRIGSVHLGDSKELVQAAWKSAGAITERPGKDGIVELKAGAFTASLCRGHVVSVSREISSKFNDFASFAAWLVEAHGPAGAPEVFSANYKRPATDPRGEFTLTSAVVRLRWDKAPNYMLQYYEVNGETHVTEGLNGPNACKP